MRLRKTEEQKVIDEIIKKLTVELNADKDRILKKVGDAFDEKNYSYQQFNGVFGGKNNTYVDSVTTQFTDFDDFYAKWLEGLFDTYESDKKHQVDNYGAISWDKASFRIVEVLKDEEIERYVRKFLEKSFYRRISERTRVKPDQKLWSLWFGYKLVFGIIIAPVRRKGVWTNDVSEIRRTKYSYWTVGHILTEGIIDPEIDERTTFDDLDDLCTFYQSVLKRLSNSAYEKEISNRYIDYLKKSANPLDEPFLIPELRYGGEAQHHEHRLDFTILNPHTLEFTGIEISPASSHMAVENLASKQNKVNEDLKKKWEKEMKKRNDYFKDFGINIITFTDSHLVDLDACFDTIRDKLANRPKKKATINNQIQRLKGLK